MAFALALWGTEAVAIPSYAIQTSQPCSACHVGSFGPGLRQQGRDFKLYGYNPNDTQWHGLPLAILAEGTFTRTQKDQPGPAAPGYANNNNFAFDSAAFIYGGRVTPYLGAFAEVDYDGISKRLTLNEIDIRHVTEVKLFGRDAIIGFDVNNSVMTQDIWQAHAEWGFPFQSSSLAPRPAASPLIENAFDGNVAGAGVYTMWDDWLYLEATLYKGLGRDFLKTFNIEKVNGGDSLRGLVPYWRAAVQHEFADGRHYVQFGTFGIAASLYPGADKSTGLTDRYIDTGFDAIYQFVSNIEDTTAPVLNLNGSIIRETADLYASRILLGTRPSDSLTWGRISLSYSIAATFTPSIQFFGSSGTADIPRWGTANGSPNSSGWIFELAYSPWGKPASSLQWLNARILAQYTAYTRFDGARAGASDNNTFFVGATIALALNR